MRHVAVAAGLVVLIALVYGGAVRHGFVFDDQSLVVDNPAVRLPLSRAHELLFGPEVGIAYRPLRIFSYMVDHRIAGGLDPMVFHASNLVYHAAATLALYALAFATLGSVAAAFVAGAVFAVHPLGSEAVVYVAGRRDLLSTLFVLLALRCWWTLLASPPRLQSRRAGATARHPAALVGMVLFGVLGIAAKETAIVLPALAALLWVVHRVRSPVTTRSPALATLVISTVALLTVGVLLYADDLAPSLGRIIADSLAPQPALSLRVVGTYTQLALWPSRLLADYRADVFPMPLAAIDAPSALAAAGIALIVVVGCVLLLRGAIGGAGLLWFLIALLPVAQIVPYSEVVSEHNAYLPLAGLALAVGNGAAVAYRVAPRAAALAIACLVLALGIRSHDRAADWADNLTLWRATVAAAPESVRGQFNLGIALLGEGQLLDARAALESTVALAPDDRDALLALATLHGRFGEYARAREFTDRALALRHDGRGLTTLGWVQLGQGDSRGALASFEAAVALGDAGDEALEGLERARKRAQ